MIIKDPMQETRKRDHIEMATNAQTSGAIVDSRFFYEPLLSAHPTQNNSSLETTFFGKNLGAPFWISSMTGGVGEARVINQNLARVAREFKLGMGLGSCRVLLESDQYFEDFNLRPILGDDLPFFANLGIAQLEKLVLQNEIKKIANLVERLEADGLIIHVNPLQEWFQVIHVLHCCQKTIGLLLRVWAKFLQPQICLKGLLIFLPLLITNYWNGLVGIWKFGPSVSRTMIKLQFIKQKNGLQLLSWKNALQRAK